MSSTLLENTYEIPAISGDEHHFWVTDGPLFDTTLLCIPPRDSDKGSFSAVLRFFDPDGYLFNEAQIDFSTNQVSVLELSQFMESCKIHNGLRHGHLFVMSEKGASFTVRAGSQSKASILNEPFLISKSHTACFPILFAPHKRTFITVVNHDNAVGKLRCRLIAGKRSPEVTISLPPLGASILNAEVEFPEFFSRERSSQLYVRLSSISDGSLGVSCFEETRSEASTNTYVGLC